jgi:hypothetical protein
VRGRWSILIFTSAASPSAIRHRFDRTLQSEPSRGRRSAASSSYLISQWSFDRSAIFAASISVIGLLGGPYRSRVLTCPVGC